MAWHRETKPFDRKRYYALLQVGKADLGWDDDFYRHVWLPRLGAKADQFGRYSAASLSNAQLGAALDAMKELGFKVKPSKGTRRLADDAQSRKIRVLWLELHADGKVRDPSEFALVAYVRRMAKVDALQWLSSGQASIVIEALKKWQAR